MGKKEEEEEGRQILAGRHLYFAVPYSSSSSFAKVIWESLLVAKGGKCVFPAPSPQGKKEDDDRTAGGGGGGIQSSFTPPPTLLLLTNCQKRSRKRVVLCVERSFHLSDS